MAIKYRKFQPAEYVMKVRNGKVLREGMGLSFFYNTRNTAILSIPTTAIDTAFAFDDIMTQDFQSCFVQGTITYKFSNCPHAAKMLDFSFAENKNENAAKRKALMEELGRRLVNGVKTVLVRSLAAMDIRAALKSADELVANLAAELGSSGILSQYGIEIIDVSVLTVSAKPETRKALEAAAREQILKEQDDAIYMRRNSAIEQERIVKENELNTEIKVAEKAREKKERNWKPDG